MFLAGKLFLLLLKPLTWIIVLLIASLLVKDMKRKRILFITAIFVALVFSNPFIYRIIAKNYEAPAATIPVNKTYEAGILLGGFVSYNVQEKKAAFNGAADRFIQTALLYRNRQIGKIIVAAGNGYVTQHDFQEAAYAKEQLMQLGIPAADIYTDPYSRNTFENAVNAKKICDSLQLKGTMILVSSALHLPRAEKLFIKQGMSVLPYPSDFVAQDVANNFWEDYLLPSSETLYHWDALIKEWMGILVYKLQGKV